MSPAEARALKVGDKVTRHGNGEPVQGFVEFVGPSYIGVAWDSWDGVCWYDDDACEMFSLAARVAKEPGS